MLIGFDTQILICVYMIWSQRDVRSKVSRSGECWTSLCENWRVWQSRQCVCWPYTLYTSYARASFITPHTGSNICNPLHGLYMHALIHSWIWIIDWEHFLLQVEGEERPLSHWRRACLALPRNRLLLPLQTRILQGKAVCWDGLRLGWTHWRPDVAAER